MAAIRTLPARRPPGISVTVSPPARDDVLPRMDVAGFVGFARTGPIDVPVAIDDPARFRDVFGAPLRLLREARTGADVHAHLAGAVDSFFANGGRRCWVVRVCGRGPAPDHRALAVRASFDVGLHRLRAGGNLEPLLLRARAAGSWADDVVAGAAALSRAVGVSEVAITSGAVHLRLFSGSAAVHDLIRLSIGNARFVFAVTTVDGAAVRGDGAWVVPPTAADTGPFIAHVVTLELTASGGENRVTTLRDVGCVPGHPRYLGGLLTDEDLALGRSGSAIAPPWSFPLAGPAVDGDGVLPVIYPPESPVTGAGPVSAPAGELRLDRDGLRLFRPGDLLDPRLAAVGVRALPATVEQLRDVGEQRLLGLHALLAVDEVTLVALPDLVHRPWGLRTGVPPLPPLPGHETYRETAECAHDTAEEFHDLPQPALPKPAGINVRIGTDGTITLSWDPIPAATFVLEESVRPWTWAGAAEVQRGPATSGEFYGRAAGRYLYRLRAETAEAVSDWSDTVVADVPGPDPFTTADPDLDALAAAQLSAVTACAARGDLFAALAAPAGHRREQADALTEAIRARAGADERLLSFGALYHPWVRVPDGAIQPPDGVAAGLLSATAAGPGCWREPANLPLSGVTALEPDPGVTAVLGTAPTNLLMRRPHGTVALTACTLSADDDLSRIAVRRLLSLIRRLAQRHGPEDVFEPVGERLRRQVRRRFEDLLARLLARGAFAGPGPAQSYQVVVESPGQDRLVTELRIAPAGSVRYLVIRLNGSAAGLTTEEGER